MKPWERDFEELKEDLKHCHWSDWSEFKWKRLTKHIEKTLRRSGGIDYLVFPPDFRWQLCSSRLSQGKFHNWDGWEFRSNWSITFQGYNGGPKSGMVPKWKGDKVKRLVIACEQGVGDEIIYSSAIPELIVRLGHEALELQCHPRLFEIFKRSFRIKVSPRRVLSQIDGEAVVALADLFMFYRRDKTHFPKKPFLKADPVLVEKYRKILEKYPKPWIGVAWGSRKGVIDPEIFCKEALKKYGGTLFDVQYKLTEFEYPAKPDFVVDLGVDMTEDKESEFAVVSCLDRVVSVTQTLVHIAGSQGVLCDVIKPSKGTGKVNTQLWYYGLGGSPHDHLVYGNMRVFESPDDWRSHES